MEPSFTPRFKELIVVLCFSSPVRVAALGNGHTTAVGVLSLRELKGAGGVAGSGVCCDAESSGLLCSYADDLIKTWMIEWMND